MTLWRQSKNISLALPEELLYAIDEAAKKFFMCRSAYIRYTLNEVIQNDLKNPVHMRNEIGDIDPKWLDMDDS